MINIRDLTQEELDEEIIKLGEKKFRAKQIFAWLYRGVDSFDEMTDLSKELIQKLKLTTPSFQNLNQWQETSTTTGLSNLTFPMRTASLTSLPVERWSGMRS